MTTRNQVLYFLPLVGALGLNRPVVGQNTPQISAKQDSLKGQIWTATALRLWADHKPAPKVKPTPWATYTEFDTWRKKNPDDKSGIHQLYQYVLADFGGKPATATELAQVIPEQIRQNSAKDRAWLKTLKVEPLTAELNTIVASTKITNPSVAASETLANNTATGASAATTRFPEDTTQTPDLPASLETAPAPPTPVASGTPFGWPFYVVAVGLFLLGTAAGAGLFALLKPTRRSSRRHQEAPPSSEPNTSIDMFKQDRTQKSEIQRLKGRIHHLEREKKDLQAQLESQSAADPTPAPQPQPADDNLLSVFPLAEVSLEPAELPTPPATRYGPVQETPFLEDRKLANIPLPQLALMLTIQPGSPDEASFTLNPQVNQSMLIGDGLNRLQKFFDYDPPVGRISSVTAATPGRLHRQADGWQVVERARLIIR